MTMGPAMQDASAALVWLAVNALLVRAAWKMSRKFFPEDMLLARLLHVVVLCWASIVSAAILLGLVGWLTAPALLASVAAVAGGMLWHIWRWPPTSEEGRFRNGKMEQLRMPDEQIWLGVWGGVLASLLAWVTLEGLLRFPMDWDTLTYHLPLIVQWLQRGSLYAPDEANWANPGNNELLGLWIVAPFSGDFLIALNNLPAIFLLALSTAEFLTRLGVARPWCHVCGWAVLATFPVLNQALTAGNDVAVAGLFLATLSYTLRFLEREHGADLGLAAVTLGLLTGIKFYALGYTGIAGVSMVGLVWAMRGRRVATSAAIVALGGVLLWGSYWYVRNTLLTGAPLYPKGLTSATDLQTRIRPDHWWQTSILGNDDPSIFPLLSQAIWRYTGPCHWVAVQVLPCLLIWLVASACWFRRHDPSRIASHGRLALGGWLAATAILWGMTPFSVTAQPGTLDMLIEGYSPVRYGICFLSLAVLSFGLLLHDLSAGLCQLFSRPVWMSPVENPNKIRRPGCSLRNRTSRILATLPLVAFAVAVLNQLVHWIMRNSPQKSREADLVLLLGLNLLLLTVLLILGWRSYPQLRLRLAAAVMLGLACSAAWVGERWHEHFADHYDSFFRGSFFKQQLPKLDPASTHICVASYRYYPFFGSRRQFHASRPLWLPSYSALIEYLNDRQSTLIVATNYEPLSGFDRYSRTDQWVHEHSEVFFPIEEGSYWVIYRVNLNRLSNPLVSR